MLALNRPWLAQYNYAKIWGFFLSLIAHLALFSLILLQFSWDKVKESGDIAATQLISVEIENINPTQASADNLNKEINQAQSTPDNDNKMDKENKPLKENNTKSEKIKLNNNQEISKLATKRETLSMDKSAQNADINLAKKKIVEKSAELPQLAKVENELSQVQNNKINKRKSDITQELAELKQQNFDAAASQETANSELQALKQQKNKENNEYISKIRNKIRANMGIIELNSNPEVHYLLDILPDGAVVQPIKLLKSSGIPALDDAVERAIIKSSPLPKPLNSMQRKIELRYRPLE